MSVLTPIKIYEDFKNKIIDKNQASDLLISLIDEIYDNDDNTRILGVKLLGLIKSKSEKVFNFLENILISDLNDQLRGQVAKTIIFNFPERAIKPIFWVLKHDNDSFCIFQIIKSLEKTSDDKLKALLKIRQFVNFEGNIFFPSRFYPLINLNNRNIKNIKKVKNLENLTDLKKLYLNYNQISKINGLNTLTNLRSLHLQGNRIKKIEGLSNLKKLEFLYLNNNDITIIEGINNLSNLKSLMLFDNEITRIRELEKLSKLEVLNLRNNQISEIRGLKKLTNLRRLDLSNNQISEIKGLEKLTKLEFLDLSHNKIKAIKGLENLRKLKFLDLRNNGIEEIIELEYLKELTYLYLGFNKITEIENIERFKHIKALDIKNADGIFIPISLFDVDSYNKENLDESASKLEMFRDIKFIPNNFKSESVLKELNSENDYLKHFTDSSWMLMLKSNEYEIFRLNKNGYIKWIQRRKKHKIK